MLSNIMVLVIFKGYGGWRNDFVGINRFEDTIWTAFNQFRFSIPKWATTEY